MRHKAPGKLEALIVGVWGPVVIFSTAEKWAKKGIFDYNPSLSPGASSSQQWVDEYRIPRARRRATLA
jgi:hypothetical protein